MDDYKLIFMDFSMPGLDGSRATVMIRDLYKTEAKMAAQNTDSLLTKKYEPVEPFICFVTAYSEK